MMRTILQPPLMTLFFELLMGFMLIAGVIFVKKRRIRAHAFGQSSAVLLSIVFIVWKMVPSFLQQVIPNIPAHLKESHYAISTIHHFIGAIAELYAIYVLLSAGTAILPASLKFTNYKPWMRTAFVLWWMGLLLGIATYLQWYLLLALSVQTFSNLA